MTELEALDARLAITRTMSLYSHHLDDLRLEAWGELFCEDGTWAFGAFKFVGRRAIVEGVGAMEPKSPGLVKHLSFAPVIDVDGDEAYSWADAIAFTVSAEANTVVAVGRYFDVMRREDGRWRFFSRLFVPSGEPVPDGVRRSPAF
jgi:hypothetical protein